MNDTLLWTPEGLAALQEEWEYPPKLLTQLSEQALEERVHTLWQRLLPSWKRGERQSVQELPALLAKLDQQWNTKVSLSALSALEAAMLASLFGASSSEEVTPFAELMLRKQDGAFVIETLVELWNYKTDSKNPDWPHSEARTEVKLYRPALTDVSLQDVSVSYARSTVTYYLYKSQRNNPAQRAEFLRAMAPHEATLPAHTRAAFLLLSEDTPKAEAHLLEVLGSHAYSWSPYFVLQALPRLVRSPSVLKQLEKHELLPFSHRFIESVETEALPFYERLVTKRIGAPQRERFLRQLTNFHGARTAAVLAMFSDKAPHKETIRSYFQRYPELLATITDTTHRAAAEKLLRTKSKKRS